MTVADVLLSGQAGAGSLCMTVSGWPSVRYCPQDDGFEGCMLCRPLLGFLKLKIGYQSE